LGFLLGGRFLLLEHRGRVSGRPRRVVLEVIGRPAPDSYLVVSGFGTRAQWYRNVRATPRVGVTVGVHRPRPAQAHILDRDEAASALTAYAKAHPRAWASFGPILDTTLGAPAHTVPVVRFDLLPR
jgi:deazaflavin-dependent oxidoreductase (nitroreductase family)